MTNNLFDSPTRHLLLHEQRRQPSWVFVAGDAEEEGQGQVHTQGQELERALEPTGRQVPC